MLDFEILTSYNKVFGGVIILAMVYILYLRVYDNERFTELRTRYDTYIKIAAALSITFIGIYCLKKVTKSEDIYPSKEKIEDPFSKISPVPSQTPSIRSQSIAPSPPASVNPSDNLSQSRYAQSDNMSQSRYGQSDASSLANSVAS